MRCIESEREGPLTSVLMQPEISRRCLSCGAAVRSEAMFCPECGQPLSRAGQDLAQTIASDAPAVVSEAPESAKADQTSPAAVTPSNETQAKTDKTPSTSIRLSPDRQSPAAGERLKTAKARETLHRASTVARGALEDNVKRVEKIRHVSSVVLEEAHYDPSLRFVLVALGVFIVFLILLVLSKVMG